MLLECGKDKLSLLLLVLFSCCSRYSKFLNHMKKEKEFQKDQSLVALGPTQKILEFLWKITCRKYQLNIHHSFIQDTPDFLREIEALNENQNLPANTVLVTIDVSALYTNIPQNEGLEAAKEALENMDDTAFNDFIFKILEIVLKYNIF